MISSTKYLTYDAAYYLTKKVKDLVDSIDVDLDKIDLSEYVTMDELDLALDGLKGEKGDPGEDGRDGISIRNIFTDNYMLYVTMTDGTTYNLGNIKGADGNVSFDQLTPDQIEMLKGSEGQAGATFIPSVASDGTLTWVNTGGYANPVPVNIKGQKGEPFKYEDFTEEQLASLKGADGTMSFEDLTPAQKESLRGEPGQRGEKGNDGDPGVFYGTDAPTDGTPIWINPDGESAEDYLTVEEVDTVVADKVNEMISKINPADLKVDLSGVAGINHKHTKADITDFPVLGSASKAEVGTTISIGSDLLPTAGTVYNAVQAVRTEILDQIPSLVGYATTTYVANAIANANDMVLDDYATKEYVTDALANVEAGNVDLSNYYNKEEVNALIPKPTDLSGYYTKAEVESAIDAKIAQQTHITEAQVIALIDTKLGVIENGSY
jgi:hypothetical protein